ncbi:MAG: asparaginase [Clostridia bacterium]|nr:asparaginase [Clostridia bacterium]
MKICVVFTGGTIGSAMKNGYITPTESAPYTLINNYVSKYGRDVQFVTSNPYTILSENLSAEILNKLIESLEETISSDCDGVIVAHGTDTLQYSAVAAEYCFGTNTKPIVFVSANHPLEHPLSNGNINFSVAVEFIKQKLGRGVYVSYSNDLVTADIHRPSNLLRHAEYDHKIFSLNGVYATYKDGNFCLNQDLKYEEITPAKIKTFCDTSGILNITVSPFDEYNYSLDGVKAIVFTPYHSGTLSTGSQRFKDFAKKANEKFIPMYVTGLVQGVQYQSVKEYSDLKIIPVYSTTSISLIMKLWLFGEI